MALKFGILFSLRNPARWRKPWPQLYQETLEQIVIAEELGFDSVWISEHHGAEDGYCPSVLPVAAVAADRTSTITIGTRLMLLPLHHPVRVAEDAAVVDVLSEGRFVLGVAVGYVPREYPAFGVNRRFRPSLTEEGIEIIRRCWREDDFDFEGNATTWRGCGSSPSPSKTVVRRPGSAVAHHPLVERVARLGDGFHFVGGRTVYDLYAAAMQRHGRDPRAIPVYDSRDFWLGEDDTAPGKSLASISITRTSATRSGGERQPRPTATLPWLGTRPPHRRRCARETDCLDWRTGSHHREVRATAQPRTHRRHDLTHAPRDRSRPSGRAHALRVAEYASASLQ